MNICGLTNNCAKFEAFARNMYKLNLPEFDIKLKKSEGKVCVFDEIRRKYVVLTPEEWVRQHFINYLINHLHYPKALMKVESGLFYNTLAKRSDIVIFGRSGAPWMLIECKSPLISVNDQTITQAAMYNHTIKASFLVATNGLKHYVAETDWTNRTTRLLEEFPDYPV